MLRNIAPTLALMLSMCAGLVSAQEFDNFRLVGENVPAGAGFVTSISLPATSETAQISFLNVAGLSKVYDVTFTPSQTIRNSVPVFMPPPGFSDYQPPALDLTGVEFFNGTLVDSDGAATPPNWFRMTKYDGRWSGVFRIADRIYAIERDNDNPVIDVRHTPSPHDIFQPARRVKVSAVIDEEYLFANGSENGHLLALESIHVMDGLLADTLSITVLLEQLIYQPADALTSPAQIFDLQAGAESWLNSNGEAFGLTDNIATLFFRDATNASSSLGLHPDNGLVGNNTIIQGNYSAYQFSSAHYFGKLLGLFDEPLTLQDWAIDAEVALASAHWTDRQKEFLDFNPPSADLTQILSYDAPEIAAPPVEEINEVDRLFVDSDSPESDNSGPALLNDDDASGGNANTSGGGSYSPGFIALLLLILWSGRVKTLCDCPRMRVVAST